MDHRYLFVKGKDVSHRKTLYAFISVPYGLYFSEKLFQAHLSSLNQSINMYHENVASIASRWKHQVDTLGQRIESEKEKQKFYTGQINAKKVSFQKLNAELKEKRNACYESRSTLKTFEDSRIELTNTMAHLERQLYLQQKNNKIDQERLEEVYGEVLSGVDNLMERAKNCVPQGQLVDLKMKWVQAVI